MNNILAISTSIFGQDGQSSYLVDKMLANLSARYPEARVVHRNLAEAPVPHLDADRFGAFVAASDKRSPSQQAVVSYSDALIDELREADAIVLGVPMYNFGIPSALKAYFDHIARSGVTFRYTENGPEGLLADRPVYVLAARGGIYAGTDRDTQTPYIRTFLGFLGIRDVTFVYAEGLNMGEDRKNRALDQASSHIDSLTAA